MNDWTRNVFSSYISTLGEVLAKVDGKNQHTYHEAFMEVRSQEIVHELFRLFIFGATCLVLEDHVVIPAVED